MASKSGSGKSRKNTDSGGASMRWLIPVAAVSGFVGFLVYLNTIDPAQDQRQEDVPTISAPQTDTGEKEREDPEFRFYEMLPESEVMTPNTEAYEPEPDLAAQDREYILQAGSFRTREDAERQRAQVGFQGLRAQITEVSVEGNKTWYRVMVGPYGSRSDMNKAVDRLVSINIQPLVRERKTDE
ncbi:sporulation related protein [Halospina denitrificans]|uniref:Sporulation related protein n=1 Tax=Halospina denitrificans TaxID=332522 RepID=A0A4R7JGU7_9GAMM|nr:SPOR domain-containing protein [Halospina denitrificans]TDT37031.1 sporulation related protein [Halospina denitrificans]